MKGRECKHKRIKKNYPFGRKSTAMKSCKDCGKILKNKDIEKKRNERKKKKR